MGIAKEVITGFMSQVWNEVWKHVLNMVSEGDFEVEVNVEFEGEIFGVVVCGCLEIDTSLTPSTHDTPEWNDVKYEITSVYSMLVYSDGELFNLI